MPMPSGRPNFLAQVIAPIQENLFYFVPIPDSTSQLLKNKRAAPDAAHNMPGPFLIILGAPHSARALPIPPQLRAKGI
jgi:hypothetical protein